MWLLASFRPAGHWHTHVQGVIETLVEVMSMGILDTGKRLYFHLGVKQAKEPRVEDCLIDNDTVMDSTLPAQTCYVLRE
jgi:hypothetical protein